jgi:hypothetical protein
MAARRWSAIVDELRPRLPRFATYPADEAVL